MRKNLLAHWLFLLSIAHWTCTDCEKTYLDENGEYEITDTIRPKLTHELTHYGEKQAFGWENGNIEYWYCFACEKCYANGNCTEEILLEDTMIVAPYSIPDFIIEVEENRDPIVLQLTDTQIIDAAQARPGRTGVSTTFWATDQIEERCYDYLTEVITKIKPDFIIITGDIVYGEFDDSGTALVSFIKFMDSFAIPWSPIFGNHDNESVKGVDWQCEQFKKASYCLFEQKTLTGNGNYSVAIAQGGVLKRVFYLLDSNGCSALSAESMANGHTTKSIGFGEDQIEWYTQQITEIKNAYPDTKISFAYHIQQYIFEEALRKYGFNQAEKYQDINIDCLQEKSVGDLGYIGRQLKGPWDQERSVWNGMKALGVDSVFVGHEHCNSASVVYDGVRFQFGQKSSEYDRFNCISSDGVITGNFTKTGTSLVGGTVISLNKEDGVIKESYIYYCGFEDGKLDWAQYKKAEEIEIGGLQNEVDFSTDSTLSLEKVVFGGTNAYKVVADAQGKVYINTDLFRDKSTVTFSVYVPSGQQKLSGLGVFAVRVKPDDDSSAEITGYRIVGGKGYIDYDTDGEEAVKVVEDTWQTFTVNISTIAETCTEFSFVIAAKNTIYIKDIILS